MVTDRVVFPVTYENVRSRYPPVKAGAALRRELLAAGNLGRSPAITATADTGVVSFPSSQDNGEDDVQKGIFVSLLGLALLTGCGSAADKGVPVEPKWKGAPYHIAFDTPPAKPNPAGITIPGIKFTANPEALETRALLVMKFGAAGAGDESQHRMVGAPVDIKGAEGALPADYMDRVNKGLAEYLGAYCMKGKVNVSVALARSSLNPQAEDAEMDAKRLSGWLPIELEFKNPHKSPKC